jgi:hypothetical protein
LPANSVQLSAITMTHLKGMSAAGQLLIADR